MRAVKFFAGIRDAEADRMTWDMIDLDVGEIHLPAGVTKTADHRTVKISDNLRAWLSLGERKTDCGETRRRFLGNLSISQIQETNTAQTFQRSLHRSPNLSHNHQAKTQNIMNLLLTYEKQIRDAIAADRLRVEAILRLESWRVIKRSRRARWSLSGDVDSCHRGALDLRARD